MLFSRKNKNRKGQTNKRPESFKRQKASSLRSITSTASESSVASAFSPASSSRHGTPSVRFSRTLTVKQTLHVRDYTPEEASACWYDRFEFEEIVNEAKFVVSLYDDPDLLVDENKYPRRGLESYMLMHNDDTAKQSRLTVLKEQRKLKSTNRKLKSTKKDASKVRSRIESAYTVFTQGSRMQARLLALSDELAINEDTALMDALMAGYSSSSSSFEPVPMRM
jgi:hypothetical protein